LSTPLPHPNVGANGVVCCDVFGNWSEGRAAGALGWSPAYSPYSVIVQLLALQEGGVPVRGFVAVVLLVVLA
jgi:ubiquitin-protein ligase